MGFLVKIDTNGSRPEVLQQLLENQLIDYVALDFKAMPIHFEKITQSNLFLPFEKSLQLLVKSGLPFEVRTTVHSDLIDTNHMEAMIQYLEQQNYQGNYYIQHFVNGATTLGKLGYSVKELEKENLSTACIKVHFRG
jgi:pyruvate formate lyase activating enzyme